MKRTKTMYQWLKHAGGLLLCAILLVTIVQIREARAEDTYIQDDAFVHDDNTNRDKVMKKTAPAKLIVGKKRHAYIRLDLSVVKPEEAQEILLGLTREKGADNTIVVTPCSEYLRTESGADSEELWTEDNITYTLRPLDLAGEPISVTLTGKSVEIDVKDLVSKAVSEGKTKLSLHITTDNVDDSKATGTDLFSSRADKGWPYLNIVKTNGSGGYILNDAFVSGFNGQDQTIMTPGKKDKLIFGKKRHIYMRFDLSSFQAEDVETFILHVQETHANNTMVITQCSEYLQQGGVDSGTKWREDNITYNNRPLDFTDTKTVTVDFKKGASLDLDVTELLKSSMEKGMSVASLHITTADVDVTTINASELYSTRSATPPYLEPILKNQEQPEEVFPEKTAGNYYNTGILPQKVFRIKGEDGSYLKLEDEDGGLVRAEGRQDASLFELYLYDYTEYEDEDYTKTTCAIRCLDNEKFLTIQNYFSEEDDEKKYFNEISEGFEIKAGADTVNWNERFYLRHYPQSGTYALYSHLKTLRDDMAFAITPVRPAENMLFCAPGNKTPYRFEFETVTDHDRLEVIQEVTGNEVLLSWYPVNGDDDLTRYEVAGEEAVLGKKGDKITAILSGLQAGSHEFKVVYTNGERTQERTVKSQIFVHPGVTHSQEALETMKEHIENRDEPWYSDYLRLKTMVPDHMASADFLPKAWEGVGRGNPQGHGNISDFEQSGNAAYFNALQWVITGEDKYAKASVKILNAWSESLKIVDGRDRILGAAINSYRYINAAEIIRYYDGGFSGYSDKDFEKFQNMLENVIYPVIEDFGVPMLANGNWDTAAMISMASIGVLCDNPDIYNRAMDGYQDIHINGSIAVYVSDWGQSVESARDQAHAQLGIGYMAEVCQVAFNQGDDSLYSLYDNRLAKAFNWAARYNLYDEEEIQFEPLMNVFGDTKRGYWTSLDSEKINRGELRPVYELPLSYYSTVDGVDVTWMERAAQAMRPQSYVHNDNLNFGTMTSYSGESTETCEPYFQIRTRLEPWYQRTWSDVRKYGEPEDNIPETLDSYFTVNENGEVTASARKARAPYFQLKRNEDGTYGVLCTATDTYLSVKEEQDGTENRILADAEEVGEHEKFLLKCTGAGFYYLEAVAFDNRIVSIHVEHEGDPRSAVLTMRLGNRITDRSADISNDEKLIFVYNTGDRAGENTDGEMEGISITKLPDQTVYQVGEELNTEGMVVVASYSNATKKTLKEGDYQVLGYDSQKAGRQKLDVVAEDAKTGKEFSDSFYVEVTDEAFRTIEIEMKQPPYRLEYEVGDHLDPSGIQVDKVQQASPSNALRREAIPDPETECEFEYNFDEEGTHSVTVIYREEDENGEEQTFTTDFSVVVREKIILPEYYTSRINVERRPNKLTYLVGEDLDFTGMVVKEYLKASPSNASPKTRILEDDEYEAVYDFTKPGRQKVKIVSYGVNKKGEETRFTDQFYVTVKEPELWILPEYGSDGDDGDDSDYRDRIQQTTGPVPETGNWTKGEQGWVFVKSNGSLAKQEWVYLTWNGKNLWYYFNQDGFMATGWLKDWQNWYYLKPDGSMASTEWVMSDGKWYYAMENGDIASDRWVRINETWYYFYSDGRMAAGEKTPDGYHVNESGAWIS